MFYNSKPMQIKMHRLFRFFIRNSMLIVIDKFLSRRYNKVYINKK